MAIENNHASVSTASMTSIRSLPFLAFLLIAVFLNFSYAGPNDVTVDINATTINRIISVDSQFNNSQLIPGYEYVSNIVVNWAIPNESLDGIVADKVTIFVEASIERNKTLENSPLFYFKDGMKKLNMTYITLDCAVVNHSCAPSSRLSQSVSLFMQTPSSGLMANNPAQLVFRASLKPFENFLPIYNETIDLGRTVNELRDKLSTMNLSIQNLTQLNESLNAAEEALSEFHIDDAKAKLNELKPALGVYNGSLMNLAFSLSFLGTGFGALVSDVPYFSAFLLGIAVFIAAIACKLRLVGKVIVALLSLMCVIAAFMKLADPFILIVAEIILGALPLAIVYFWRGKGKRRPVRDNDFG